MTDPLGNPLILMDEDGNIVKRYRFDPFGNLEAQWGTEPNHYLFTGKEKDESGLYYFGARYYNPRLGRWITPEPRCHPNDLNLKDPQSLNPYSYCRNNPLVLIDPDGKVYRSIWTGEILDELQLQAMTWETIRGVLWGLKPVLPYYHEAHISALLRGGKYIPILEFGPITKLKRPRIVNLDYTPYPLIQVQPAAIFSQMPLEVIHIAEIGVEKGTGAKVIQIRIGGTLIRDNEIIASSDRVILITGTIELINEYLRQYGYEVIWNEEEDEYILQPINTGEEE